MLFLQEFMDNKEYPPPETLPAAARRRSVGRTRTVISGSLGTPAWIQPGGPASSTTFGSSLLPPTNGRGWMAALHFLRVAKYRTPVSRAPCPASMEPIRRLQRETLPEAARTKSHGPTRMATFGSLGELDSLLPAA